MMRKQLYIDEELDHALKSVAARTGRSEADHVRAALRSYLQTPSIAASAGGDPLGDLVGLVRDPDGPDDVATRHDEYLYGANSAA